VPSEPRAAPSEARQGEVLAGRVSLRSAASLLKQRSFRGLVLAGIALGLTTISDAFLYLSIQQRMQLSVGFFPLLFVITAAAFMILAVPMGRLADRYGRGKVFIAGYVVLLFVYSILLHETIGWVWLLFYLALHGGYYAATDGVLMALASQVLPERLRGSGLALLGTAVGLARLLSSVIFGILWTVFGLEATVAAFGGLLLVAIVVGAFHILPRDSNVIAT
jgi:MFS family permease